MHEAAADLSSGDQGKAKASAALIERHQGQLGLESIHTRAYHGGSGGRLLYT